RRALGIPEGRLVLGLFGSGHSRRMLGRVGQVARRLRELHVEAMLLYVGTNGTLVKNVVSDLLVRDEGALPSREVSRRLRAMDLYLSPFEDGISTRRGSMLAGLQHGLALLGTLGPHTDQVLCREDGRSFLLAPVEDEEAFVAQALRMASDPELRARLGEAARE